MQNDIVIVGGGLSGLRLASLLAAQRKQFLLLEARGRLGGRILTEKRNGRAFDLGPAWFWPGQPRIEALIAEFGLSVFEQYAQGALSFEHASGQVERGKGFSSMQGSFRVEGGLGVLVEALVEDLSAEQLSMSCPVAGVEDLGDGVAITCANGEKVSARRVVFAMPPRLIASLGFAPALPAALLQALERTPTWMAGQAKAVAVYTTPFWRDAGLSGDALSHRGPLAEIHDASPRTGPPYALFGFVGAHPAIRQDEAALRQAILAQLERIFGAQAANPDALLLKDWAHDPFTATPSDYEPLLRHPTYGAPQVLSGLWDGRVLFAGTEMAARSGGYLEGALEAAEVVFNHLTSETV